MRNVESEISEGDYAVWFSSIGLPVYGSNLYFGAVWACGGRAGGEEGGSELMLSSASFSPFLNSTIPLPMLRPTSGRRLPKISRPRPASSIISKGPGHEIARR